MTRPKTPAPDVVAAARAHVTSGYAAGVEELLWETRRHLMPDLDAIRAVIDAAAEGRTSGPDLAAALVLTQAVRLDLDRLEADLLVAVRQAGLEWDTIAAVLG